MFKKNNQNFTYVRNNKELDQFITKIKNKKIFFIDTEFERRTTYKAIISIVVIFDGKNIGIIDCIESKINFRKIFQFLNRKKITLVLHSCRQDLEIFLSIVNKILFTIFDTQIASLYVGYKEGPSYKKLVKDICKIDLDKTFQKLDWMIRPVNEDRINYLVNDVYYLKSIFNKLKNKLIKKNKLDIFNRAIKKEIYKITHENFSIIFKKKLGNNIAKNKKFIKIIDYRNKIAKKLNLPKNWIIPDKEIIKNLMKDELFISNKNLKNAEIDNFITLFKDYKKVKN
jgi:ribonuclease D